MVDLTLVGQLASGRAITDSTGSVTKTFQTDEYGIPFLTQGTSTEPFRYTGQERDAESGFYNLRARFYAPALGRFVSRDRLFGSPASPLSLNRTSYAGNNPVNFVDPSGLCLEDACIAEAAATWWLVGAVTALAVGVSEVLHDSYVQQNIVDFVTWLNHPSFSHLTTASIKVPPIPASPTESPGAGWEWLGRGPVGSNQGSWHNPETVESLHPNLDHGLPIGPHWDYIAPDGSEWRVFPDRRMEPK